MNRRDFLQITAIAGTGAILPFRGTKKDKIVEQIFYDGYTRESIIERHMDAPILNVLDYTPRRGLTKDEHGCVYDRTLKHLRVPSYWVRRACLLPSDDLLVEIWGFKLRDDAYYDSNLNYFMDNCYIQTVTRDSAKCFIGVLPAKSWEVEQWDETGAWKCTLVGKDGKLRAINDPVRAAVRTADMREVLAWDKA